MELVRSFSVMCRGQRIAANRHGPGGVEPCVVMSHGLESDKDGAKWLGLSGLLASEGMTAVRFNHRGCGTDGPEPSEGAYGDTTLSGRIEDLRAVLDALPTLGVTTDRIGCVGSSFGGMVVLGAQDPRVRALALLATPVGIPADDAAGDGGPDGESGVLARPALRADLARYDMLAAVREYRRPTLIVHGSDDDVVPVEDAHRLHEAAGEPRRLEIIPGADHRFSRPEHRARALALCLEWMRRCLA